MMDRAYEENALFEHRFWLRILEDHAHFITDALAPKEKEEIERAMYFIQKFDEKKKKIGTTDLIALAKAANEAANEIRKFKLHILRKQLEGKISIHLTPTFLNHMVNEVEEYITILKYLTEGKTPPLFHELHHHLLWLIDAAGHAEAMSVGLDSVEKRLKEKSEEYEKHFEQLYLKAVEMAGYLRTELVSFSALKKFTKDVSLEITLFSHFLHELEELELSGQMLSMLSGRMPDHMAREECYYLLKLGQSSGIEIPNCKPF